MENIFKTRLNFREEFDLKKATQLVNDNCDKVFKAFSKFKGEKLYIIKIYQFETPKQSKKFGEILKKILKFPQNPNILLPRDAYYWQKDDEDASQQIDVYAVVYDFADKDLESDIANRKKQNIQYNCQELIEILTQCVNGLYFLKKKCFFFHQNIKPSNILFFQNRIVLCDFIIFQDNEKQQNLSKITILNTTEYMSPELLQTFLGNQQDLRKNIMDKEKCDIFSLGLVLLKSFYSNINIERLNFAENFQKLDLLINQIHFQGFKKILAEILQINPNFRINLSEISMELRQKRDGVDGRIVTEEEQKIKVENKKFGEHKRVNSDPMCLIKKHEDSLNFLKFLESETNSFSKNSYISKVPCSFGDEPDADVDEAGWEEFNSSILQTEELESLQQQIAEESNLYELEFIFEVMEFENMENIKNTMRQNIKIANLKTQFTKLKLTLAFSMNDDNYQIILKQILQLQNLKVLDCHIGHCSDFTDKCLINFYNSIARQYKQLSEITISIEQQPYANNLTLQSIAFLIQNNLKMRKFELIFRQNNTYTNEGGIEIFNSLAQLSNLIHLKLSLGVNQNITDVLLQNLLIQLKGACPKISPSLINEVDQVLHKKNFTEKIFN